MIEVRENVRSCDKILHVSERNHSDSRLGKRNLHLAARKDLVMQVRNSLKTVLHRIKLHQGHVLLVGVAQDLHCLHPTELAEDLVQCVLSANVLLQRAHVQRLRRRVHSQ